MSILCFWELLFGVFLCKMNRRKGKRSLSFFPSLFLLSLPYIFWLRQYFLSLPPHFCSSAAVSSLGGWVWYICTILPPPPPPWQYYSTEPRNGRRRRAFFHNYIFLLRRRTLSYPSFAIFLFVPYKEAAKSSEAPLIRRPPLSCLSKTPLIPSLSYDVSGGGGGGGDLPFPPPPPPQTKCLPRRRRSRKGRKGGRGALLQHVVVPT